MNDIRKLILIIKANIINNKLIFLYLIFNERINGYGLIYFFVIKFNVLMLILIIVFIIFKSFNILIMCLWICFRVYIL